MVRLLKFAIYKKLFSGVMPINSFFGVNGFSLIFIIMHKKHRKNKYKK